MATRLIAVRAAGGWDPVAGRLPGPLLVLVSAETGTILDIDTSGAAPPEAATVVDCGNSVLMPGMVDGHVHLCWEPALDPTGQFLERADEELIGTGARAAAAMVRAGITTVRDLGDRGYLMTGLRDRLAVDRTAGPELLVAGPPITPTRGHCWFLGGQADGAERLARAVQERVDRGVDVVKVMATGGMLTPGWAMHEALYAAADLRVITDIAHAHGLPVVAHAHGRAGIVAAIAAGVDGIEHVTFATEESVECDWDVVDELAHRKIPVGATVAVLPGLPPPAGLADRIEASCRNFVEMHRRGVRLTISSDGGILPIKPHDVLPHGAVLFAGLGLSTADALTAVTATPAAACGRSDRKGRLALGYDADVIAVSGDPLSDITALLRPVLVIRGGTLVTMARTAPGDLPQSAAAGRATGRTMTASPGE
jgi:imidazolonepropionase-like amidohydrolase